MPLLRILRNPEDLKRAAEASLDRDYRSPLLEDIRRHGHRRTLGRLTVCLPEEFGFCYGVDRALSYAYQTRRRFPDRRLFMASAIVHNPHVNDLLRAQGIRFLSDAGESPDRVGAEDVVIVPAFGLPVSELACYDRLGCTIVDTTCGSVINVWKHVRRLADEGFTVVLHGKARHEETRATISRVEEVPDAHYVIVRNLDETVVVCGCIRGEIGAGEFLERQGAAVSRGFDPQRHLTRIGLANQTTMMASESLEIGEMLRAAMLARVGPNRVAGHFRAFETICSATQDRQDAVLALLEEEPLALMLVVGGYDSSNTIQLARLCRDRLPTYHIVDADCLVGRTEIRHQPAAGGPERMARDWLPGAGPIMVGITAGASTPGDALARVIDRLDTLAND
jgi:4-hydroxy-3-methylbut-2-enyl diphosphate reductase